MSSLVDGYLKGIRTKTWPHKGGELNGDTFSTGFAYGIFGLPYGTYPSKTSTLTPRPSTLKDSLLKVINQLLKQEEKFLLKIPLEFARLPFIDAAHIFHKKGGAH